MDKNKSKECREKEDTTKYGEFISSFFSWMTLDEQKKIFDNHDKSEIINQELFLSNNILALFKTIKYFLLKCCIERLEAERNYWEAEKFLLESDEKIKKDIQNDNSKNSQN